jgi:hypothetical protein
MAAGMGWIPILGFIVGLNQKIDPEIPALIKHMAREELLLNLSAFSICAFLYYLLGDKSWLRPHIKKHSLRVALALS